MLKLRIEDHLAGPDGHISPQLRPLAEALANAGDPRGVLGWLKHSPNARLLAELASTGQTVSHDMLDELPPGRRERYVRNTLVHAGVLPKRHEDLDRIPAWLSTVLATQPAQHSLLIRPYVHWFLLKRARRRALRRSHLAQSGKFLRTRVRVALELLTWLDDHDLTLETLTQHHLDRWLAAGNTRSFNIRYFLGWAADRGLAPRLTVPAVPRQDPAHVLDEDERWSQLQRCLTDDTLPLDVRAAGALLLLFGLPAARIRQLRPDDLPERDGSAYLNVGRHPLLLPPRLADLLHQLAAAPVNRTRLTASTQWLFPGRVPGQPAGPSGFSRKLLDHGIDARPARNAALLALIEDLPAPIMADILGLHIHTAERWADIAKRDWTGYLAARVVDQGRIER